MMMRSPELGPADAERLARSENARSLSRINLSFHDLGEGAGAALASARVFDRLEHLELGSTGLGARGVIDLLAASWLPGLRELSLYGNDAGPDAAVALAGKRALEAWPSRCCP
jgi:hypothetical protein